MRTRHAIEYYSLCFFSSFFCILPRKLALQLGYFLGRCCWLLGLRKTLVMANLKQAIPNSSDSKLRSIGSRAAGNFTRTVIEFLRCSSGDRGVIGSLVTIEGIEELRNCMSDTKGAVIITPHLGAWAIYFGVLSDAGIPISLLVGKQHNEKVDKFIHKIPGESVEMISKGRSAIKPILAGMNNGRAIVLVADQHAGKRGIPSPFLGRKASTLALPSMLVSKFDCPMFFMSGHHIGGGRHSLNIKRIDLPEKESVDDFKQVVTDRFNEHIGNAVLKHPDQYFWYHRRWRENYEAEEKTTEQ
ncbi:lysophospholipid acyltransferase family protein [Puniceicoccaceae bacterium K14]|nr:lysophospholipid acyltransferase family protein [Puniceicoccaceae bacterium K14]